MVSINSYDGPFFVQEKIIITCKFKLVAPEVLSPLGDRAYGKQCDLWSLGVMMFICLCGYPPFSDDTAPPSMKAQIKMARYEFASPYWDGISDEGKNLFLF